MGNQKGSGIRWEGVHRPNNGVTQTRDVAIFPLPGLVAFPRQVVPLHIFEPRYRKMVADCLRRGRFLGVALAGRSLTPHKKPSRTISDALKSNQATYQPSQVFCAGPVAVVDRLIDGRMLVEVHMDLKLKLINLSQTVPYYVGHAEVLHETIEQPSRADRVLKELKQFVLMTFRDILPSFWVALDEEREEALENVLALLLQYVKLDSAFMQSLLEECYLDVRAERLLEEMNHLLQRQGVEIPKTRDTRQRNQSDANVIPFRSRKDRPSHSPPR